MLPTLLERRQSLAPYPKQPAPCVLLCVSLTCTDGTCCCMSSTWSSSDAPATCTCTHVELIQQSVKHTHAWPAVVKSTGVMPAASRGRWTWLGCHTEHKRSRRLCGKRKSPARPPACTCASCSPAASGPDTRLATRLALPFADCPAPGGLPPGAPTAISTSTGAGCGERPGLPAAVPLAAVLKGSAVSSSGTQLVPPSALWAAGLLERAGASLPSSYKCLQSSSTPHATAKAVCYAAGLSSTHAGRLNCRKGCAIRTPAGAVSRDGQHRSCAGCQLS
jgi:hypothetical protein